METRDGLQDEQLVAAIGSYNENRRMAEVLLAVERHNSECDRSHAGTPLMSGLCAAFLACGRRFLAVVS